MGETVEFPSNGHTCSGYLATPTSGRGPGVVVIQEYWGLVPHIRDLCDRFAAEGFVALAPDLYHGKEAKEPDEAGKLLMALDLPEAARDMLGAGTWLAHSDRTAGDRVGIVGFCMGGALAIFAATLSDVFAAVVPFYPYMGVTAAATPDVTKIKGDVFAPGSARRASARRRAFFRTQPAPTVAPVSPPVTRRFTAPGGALLTASG